MLEAHPRGRESEGAGELDDTPLLHQRDGLKRLALASLLKDPLAHTGRSGSRYTRNNTPRARTPVARPTASA